MAFSDTVGTVRHWFSADEAGISEKRRLIEYYQGKIAALDKKKLVEERRALIAARFVRALEAMATNMPTRWGRHDLGEVSARCRDFFEAENLETIAHPGMSESERAEFPELSKAERLVKMALEEAEDEDLQISFAELYPEFLLQTDALRRLRPDGAQEAAGGMRIGHRAGRLAGAVRDRWQRLMDDLAKLQGL